MKISSLGCGLFCALALSKEPYLCISSGDAARSQALPGKGQKGRGGKGERPVLETASFTGQNTALSLAAFLKWLHYQSSQATVSEAG